MNKLLLNSEIQDFIEKNINTDPAVISLGKSPFPGVSSSELAEQIDSKKRCENKLPLWFKTKGIYYPKKLAIEQCSSEQAARYKSGLLKGEKIIDLTGGFGVDAAFFSLKAGQVLHCEINSELSGISAHNSSVLGFKVTYILRDGISFLKDSEEVFDTIYIDPSRRRDSGKVFRLQDCVPDVIGNKALLMKSSERLIIKTAPLLDIQSALSQLGNVAEIHIISIKNDCKEVLYVLDREMNYTEPQVTCAMLDTTGDLSFSFRYSEEKEFYIDHFSAPLEYLYEPDVSLLKAGCFKLITRHFKVDKLHQHTHLYTSGQLCQDFPGRKFKIMNVWDYGDFQKQKTLPAANIICRNFPLSPDKIRKKLRISDGGKEDYLIFCTIDSNRLIAVYCKKLK